MNFDIEFLQTNVERLESVFLNILYMNSDDKIISPDINILGDLKNAIDLSLAAFSIQAKEQYPPGGKNLAFFPHTGHVIPERYACPYISKAAFI